MSKEKHRKKKHHKGAANENETSEGHLFSEADAKSVEVSGYTVGRGAPQIDQQMQLNAIPTGVAYIDKSVKLPTSPLKSHDQHQDPKPYNVLQPTENYDKEHIHLPPIYNPYYYDNNHHHHHRHHHHHHKHKQEIETYDPRWWYMPINSVHAPRPWQPPEYHYVQPKWYESSSTRKSRMPIHNQESKLPRRKYVDCRCEVCRPSKETRHGIRWIVNN